MINLYLMFHPETYAILNYHVLYIIVFHVVIPTNRTNINNHNAHEVYWYVLSYLYNMCLITVNIYDYTTLYLVHVHISLMSSFRVNK